MKIFLMEKLICELLKNNGRSLSPSFVSMYMLPLPVIRVIALCMQPQEIDQTRPTGVDFTIILLEHFLYKSQLSSFSLVTFGFEIFLAPKYQRKMSK